MKKILACASLLYLLGVAGNSDLGTESNLGLLTLKCIIALSVLIIGTIKGGHKK